MTARYKQTKLTLRECPFCGGKASMQTIGTKHFGNYWVHCQKCNVATDVVSTEQAAADRWNRRHNDGN